MFDSKDPRPAALLVTRNFPPLLGGMEKVNQRVLMALGVAWRTLLCGPKGCADCAPPGTVVVQMRIKPLIGFLFTMLWRAIRLAVGCHPEWVIAGSGLTAPIAWLAARCVGARAAVYLHGLDIVAPSRIYQRLWLPFIRRCDLVLVNSRGTGELAAKNGVPGTTTHVLNPGTDLPELDAEAARRFREQHGLGQRPLLLSVGRLTRRKGLVEFVTKALPAIADKWPDVLLVVIGGEATDALHAGAGSERDRILTAAMNVGVLQNLRFLGRCDDTTLAAAYQSADVHIFPVLELPGDVEGFGMVALEAAAHGLPTVAFAVGGVPDAVQEGCTGSLIRPGDYVSLVEAVISQLTQGCGEDVVTTCREFAAGKAWPVFEKRLLCLLKSYGA